ncbi:hypothetical protein OUZ56_016334 [Daphnia magna]|uniref:Transmembrane protein n=1 Tax=Daphnia magna TaxID=35525 RepID=A0ABR0AQC2_9CRUS|nr:hypothetical protein OUZ56_016334 [Daphnia magna]
MECPQQTDSRDSSRAELPLVGIVEIPHGCSTQTDEWFLQASRRHLLSPTRKGKNFLPRLKGVNWALASLRRIGSSLVSAASSRKTILALEEDDWEREKRASGHHTYPFELWGVGAAFFMVSVSVFSIQCCRGRRGGANIADLREHLWTLKEFVEEEAKKRRAWRWSTMNCLTVIDNRMTAHEQTCLATLRDLELSIKHQARQRRILLSELIRIGHLIWFLSCVEFEDNRKKNTPSNLTHELELPATTDEEHPGRDDLDLIDSEKGESENSYHRPKPTPTESADLPPTVEVPRPERHPGIQPRNVLKTPKPFRLISYPPLSGLLISVSDSILILWAIAIPVIGRVSAVL